MPEGDWLMAGNILVFLGGKGLKRMKKRYGGTLPCMRPTVFPWEFSTGHCLHAEELGFRRANPTSTRADSGKTELLAGHTWVRANSGSDLQ